MILVLRLKKLVFGGKLTTRLGATLSQQHLRYHAY